MNGLTTLVTPPAIATAIVLVPAPFLPVLVLVLLVVLRAAIEQQHACLHA